MQVGHSDCSHLEAALRGAWARRDLTVLLAGIQSRGQGSNCLVSARVPPIGLGCQATFEVAWQGPPA